ncbi:phage tail protein [uncultured Dubosiella sp.]|uniref:phage tail tube protein n=1 Tax=uncultured Dubosiella sp. TaxID=1937011 RepID=UPI0022CC8A09|nr:phage tail protein [uncultured Dubosiella sp.]MCZ2855903.1 phage tail protein [Candidatus Bathyarchaeota archaeon]
MSNNASNVTQGKPAVAGAIAYAPIGTTLPTDAATKLNDAFKQVGYITEDGVVNSQSIETSSTKAWGGDTVLNSKTSATDTWKFAMMESLNPDALKLYYGEENVTGEVDTGMTIKANSLDQVDHVIVIDYLLKNNVLKRVVIPRAQITAKDDVTYKDDSAIVYGVTVSAVPDDDGNTHYEYIKKKGETA